MKKIKNSFLKIVSLVTAAVIFAGICTSGSIFAYTPSMQDESVYALLKELNIIDMTVDPEDGTVTRENFAVYVANMLNIGDAATDKRYFADVENTAYSSKAVNTLAEREIISEAPDKYFNPAEKITMSEAIKMLVCAIGAKRYADAKGGYPHGYNSVARELGIYNGDDSQTITTAMAATLIYKTMTVPLVTYDTISSDSVSYKKTDETILSLYWDIACGEGVITSVYGITISGAEAETEDEIAIDGTLYQFAIDAGDLTERIGEYVNYFYYDNDDAPNKQIMFIATDENSGRERLCIDIDDFKEYTEDEITYNDPKTGGRSKTQSLGAHRLFYNGAELGADVRTTMQSLNKGFIYLVDANSDNAYDTVIVFDFSNFYVSAKTNGILYNKLESNAYVDLTKAEVLSVFDTDGNVLTTEEIEAGMLLSVAKAKEDTRIWIYKSNVEFSGTVQATNTADTEITIDDTIYEIDASYAELLLTSIHPGDTAYFILDRFGKIGYVSSEASDDMKLGYILAYNLGGAFRDTLDIRMLTEDSTIVIKSISDSVTVDGERLKKDGAAGTKRVFDQVEGELLVRYKENESGTITKIDTTTVNTGHESKESSLLAEYYETGRTKWYNSYYLGRRAFLSTATKVFYIPTDSTDDAGYRCSNVSYMLLNDASYYADAYYTGSLNGTAAAAVVKYSLNDIKRNVDSQKDYFIYRDTVERLNADGVSVRYITGINGTTEESFEVDDAVSLDGIETGDILTFHFDASGRVIVKGSESYTMVYDASKAIEEQRDDEGRHWVPLSDSVQETTGNQYLLYKYISSGTTNYRIENQLSYGRAVKKYADDTIRISATSDFAPTEMINAKNLKIVVTERDSQGEIEVRLGDMSDVITAETTTDNCSKILFWTSVGVGRGVYVYNI